MPSSNSAICPSSVRTPVAYTIPTARPRVISEPLKIRLRRSPRGRSASASAAACFATGSDSPVSADSSAASSSASTRRISADTAPPAPSSTTSPGTRSIVGTFSDRPARRTRVVGTTSEFSVSSARSARYSWTMPTTAFSTTMTSIAIVSCGSPITPETIAAAIRTRIMKSLNWFQISRGQPLRRRVAIAFTPCSRRRRSTSDGRSPCSGSTLSCPATASAPMTCHCCVASIRAKSQDSA